MRKKLRTYAEFLRIHNLTCEQFTVQDYQELVNGRVVLVVTTMDNQSINIIADTIIEAQSLMQPYYSRLSVRAWIHYTKNNVFYI